MPVGMLWTATRPAHISCPEADNHRPITDNKPRGLTARRKATISPASGPMAEWLRRGLQILARRFDSGSGLHSLENQIPPASASAETPSCFTPGAIRCQASKTGSSSAMPIKVPASRSSAGPIWALA